MAPREHPALHFEKSLRRKSQFDLPITPALDRLFRVPGSFHDPVGHFAVEQQPHGFSLVAMRKPAEGHGQKLFGIEIRRYDKFRIGQFRFLDPGDGKLAEFFAEVVKSEHIPFTLQVRDVIRVNQPVFRFCCIG